MAITKSFNGQTIYKSGSYSKATVDNSAGSAIGSNDVLFLIGESSKGASGAVTGIVEYSASRLDALIANFGDGPLVDAAVVSSRPSKTPGIGGVGRYLVYKTNPSVQASVNLTKSASNMYLVKGRAYGVADNNYTVVVAAGTTSNQKLVSVTELSATTESLGENAAEDIITITYTGNGSTAVVAIAGASRAALTLTTTLAGDESDGSANLSITLANYTMKQLVDYINLQTGYTATLATANKAAKAATELDITASVTIKSAVVTIRRLATEVLELINTSTRVIATEAGIFTGVPDNQSAALTGGAQGASTNAFFSAGLSKSLGKEYNVVLPCVSRDATVDIADSVAGFTDASSTYTASSVLSAVDAHLTLRGNTKNRREAQCFAGFRNAVKATCYSTIAALNSYNMQVALQDSLFVDQAGTLKVGHPHITAALLAGMRLGTSVGEPLTYKVPNTTLVGHFLDSTTLLESGDFDPAVDADDAITNGVITLEPKGAGYRVVVDNTTYGTDASFVYNRGSVVEAVYFVQKDLRDFTDLVWIGLKTSSGGASSLKNMLRNRLIALNAPEVNVITGSDDAPNGFREDTFTVTTAGNTTTVQVEFKPVQGNDFVFYSFTVGDITQTA